MRALIYKSLGLLLLSFTATPIQAQVYFQLEYANTTDVRRYSLNDRLEYRTSEFGENWLSGKIVNILPEDKALVFYDKITYLDEITHVRYNQPWANAMGKSLMGFGIAWTSYGGVIEGLSALNLIESNYRFGWDTAAIGASTFLTGFVFQKLLARVTKKINKSNRVRILDLQF